jgi:hypothetical protein
MIVIGGYNSEIPKIGCYLQKFSPIPITSNAQGLNQVVDEKNESA